MKCKKSIGDLFFVLFVNISNHIICRLGPHLIEAVSNFGFNLTLDCSRTC